MNLNSLFRFFAVATLLLARSPAGAEVLPVRGLHLMAPKPDDIPLLLRFVREVMPKEGVTTLVLEINYRFQYTKRAEVVDENPLSPADARTIAAAAREAGVRVIPQINLFGHQSWAKKTFGLLRAHPEFDETPGKYPGNEGIYCRSYCPLHPQLHAVVFDLIDELTEAFGADTFHAGMDEVFLIADENCPRCRGRLPSDLFAGEVIALRDHLARSGKKLWIWGDRLLDGAASGAGKWEASFNGTWPAIARIPRDVVINDWHYEKAVPGAAWFAMQGFEVISCPWRKPEVALAQIDAQRSMRASANPAVASRMQGILQTTWGDSGDFIRSWFGELSKNASLNEAVKCFRAAFARLREP
jgi:hypothetical protein